jgi:Sister chromatid cohesion protein Dcc1
MLLGVAVSTVNDEARLWKYLPAEKLPTDPTVCFDALFAAKERWLLHELEPYVEHLTDAMPTSSQAELLLRFTKLVTEDRDGITLQLYQKK